MNQTFLKSFKWINQPLHFELNAESLIIETDPETDLWQKTYYGFQRSNAPAFLTEREADFTFQVKVQFNDAKHIYDQCGILLYLDSDNWVKVSVERENEFISRLGSVVTNFGYSDWASIDIPASVSEMWYRFSRRGQDCYIENSMDGESFQQMRILHLHKSFSLTPIGVYACSPLNSSFKAVFSHFKMEACTWPPHEDK